MIKRYFCSIFTILLLSFAVSALESNSQTSDVERRSIKYLVEVISKVKKNHPDGAKYTKPEYIEGAKKLVIQYLKNEDLSKVEKNKLIAFLEKSKFKSVTQLIHLLNRYSDEILELDIIKIADIAANGVVKTTKDPFSQILTMEKIMKLQQQMLSGADKSIGLMVEKKDDGKFYANFIQWNYPAFYMGIQVGDEIISINGTKLSKIKKTEEISTLLTANLDETISIWIKRKSIRNAIKLVGKQHTLNRVEAIGAVLPGNIGYIRTKMFTMTLHTTIQKIIIELQKKNVKGLILDLRNNPGGTINSALGLCDLFLEKGKILTITKSTYKNPLGKLAEMFQPGMKGKKIDDETTHYLATKEKLFDMPLVILVNKLSASASEMTSGCLQSHKRAFVVGKKTFGKGVGQTAIILNSSPAKDSGGGGLLGMLGGGKDARLLYMTVMTYFLPKGEKVHHIGITPDFKINEQSLKPDDFEQIARMRETENLPEIIYEMRHKMSARPDFFSKQLYEPVDNLQQYPNAGKFIEIAQKYQLSEKTMLAELRLATLISLQNEFDQRKTYTPFFSIPDDSQLGKAIDVMTGLLQEKSENK
ncbi:MAG: hypothetical protein K8S87_07210 [Planctomycetes bacterium]|nr:hypothetical protein [Planctomycetota bacterium]